jgi:hypothetical protein
MSPSPMWSRATEERLDQGHELELFYGLTDRLGLVTVGLLQQPIGGQLEGQQYEAGAQYEFLKGEGRHRPCLPLALPAVVAGG